MTAVNELKFSATRNPCKLCSPLGASMVFRGIKNSIAFIHGGQGCATYIRRYLISHYREPVDIASSNFSEASTIFGGESNLIEGLDNVIRQYNPDFIGIATSCLAETIGEDLDYIINKFRQKHKEEKIPEIIHVKTPSYNGTHMNGFNRAVKQIIENLSMPGTKKNKKINIFPGFVSPADMRHFKEICSDFNLKPVIFPDYSETFDSPIWEEYKKIPEGGTSLDEIKNTGTSQASIEFGNTVSDEDSAAFYLEKAFSIKKYSSLLPIGIRQNDNFFEILSSISGSPVPEKYKLEKGRLIDAYVDGHKYLFGKKAVIYGEEDIVISMSNFLLEIGIIPVLCASGGNSGKMADKIYSEEFNDRINIKSGIDFADIAEIAKELQPDIMIGNSKGYRIARGLNIPLVRIGFPIHDRIGGQRILHIGYRGTHDLFNLITNALIEDRQNKSEVGYGYI